MRDSNEETREMPVDVGRLVNTQLKLQDVMGKLALAFVPVLEKMANRLQEPSVQNALVAAADIALTKMVDEITKMPAEIGKQIILSDARGAMIEWIRNSSSEEIGKLPNGQLVSLINAGYITADRGWDAATGKDTMTNFRAGDVIMDDAQALEMYKIPGK